MIIYNLLLSSSDAALNMGKSSKLCHFSSRKKTRQTDFLLRDERMFPIATFTYHLIVLSKAQNSHQQQFFCLFLFNNACFLEPILNPNID